MFPTLSLSPFRFGSASSQASQSSGDICRICHCESDPQNPLLTPCYCSGSLKYVHQACLQQWLTASETNSCELCKFPFIMHTKIKPFNEVSIIRTDGRTVRDYHLPPTKTIYTHFNDTTHRRTVTTDKHWMHNIKLNTW